LLIFARKWLNIRLCKTSQILREEFNMPNQPHRTPIIVFMLSIALSGSTAGQTQLLIRCDDLGMTHAVNQAFKKVAATGLPLSASVMFVCPWYQEAVAMLREMPQVAVGVHLTLNAEWQNYRWGPLCGGKTVPSLVDTCGYFFPSRQALFDNQPRLEECELELRAQIERALRSGLRIDYVDYHMGTAVSTPELRTLVEQLAREYHLGISRYFGEKDARGVYSIAPAEKADSLVQCIKQLTPGQVNLLVCHIGQAGTEMDALLDLNPHGLKDMSRHRQAECDALCSSKFHKALRRQKIQLVTYRDLVSRYGLEAMRSPVPTGY